MVTPYHLIKLLVIIVLCLGAPNSYSQTLTDSIPADTNSTLPDSIHPFHRKKGDVLNYLLVDNFYNPALAGSLKSYQAQASYGNSLPGSASNHHYGSIMLDMFFGNKQGRHGLAFRMSLGHIGFSNSIRQRFDYSFQILNKKNFSLRAGVGVGYMMEQFQKTGLTWGDMLDDRYGFVYGSQETITSSSVATFKVTRFHWAAGAQLRIYDGYLNFYNINDFLTTDSAGVKKYYPGFGMNALYNVDLKVMQMVPSLQLNYWNPNQYILQGGIFLASSTSKGGGGGIYYNNNNIFTFTGMFAWNDFLRIQAQVQFPFSDIRLSYPVSNFQITVSYKINDFGKYE